MTTLVSFLIVAFGQPAWVGPLGLLASIFGYALFWKGERRFWPAVLWFSAVQLVQLSWMTSDEYQGLYTWFFWILLSIGMGFQFGLLTLLIKQKMRPLRILAVPAAWTIMEWLRLYFLAGMTWNPVGLALTSWIVPRQMVALVGIYGLSFWVMLTNILVFNRKWKLAVATALFPYLFGIAHLTIHTHLQQQEEQTLSVLLVQPGICPGERSGVGCGVQGMIDPFQQWRSLLELVGPYQNQHLDLIVFPEGLVPYEANQLAYEERSAQKMVHYALGDHATYPEGSPYSSSMRAVPNTFFCQAIANTLQADVIAGLDYRRDADFYNAALFFKPDREVLSDWYGKRILIPIVEDLHNPLFAPVAKFYGIHLGCRKGKEPRVFDGVVPMGLSICYEETFSQVTRDNKQAGAELLVNITNDGWYPNSRLAKQHFHHGRLRALENGMPLLRACSIGVTAAVDSLGRTVGELESGTIPGALHTIISPYHYQTLYGIFGDGLAIGSSFLIVLLFLRRKK